MLGLSLCLPLILKTDSRNLYSVISTSFKDDSRCPEIQDVGCCSIQLHGSPPASPQGAGQSYNSENLPLISFAEDQVLPTPEADSNAGLGFPLQLPSNEIQLPTGMQVTSSEVQFPSENPYTTSLDQFSLPDTLGISLDWSFIRSEDRTMPLIKIRWGCCCRVLKSDPSVLSTN